MKNAPQITDSATIFCLLHTKDAFTTQKTEKVYTLFHAAKIKFWPPLSSDMIKKTSLEP